MMKKMKWQVIFDQSKLTGRLWLTSLVIVGLLGGSFLMVLASNVMPVKKAGPKPELSGYQTELVASASALIKPEENNWSRVDIWLNNVELANQDDYLVEIMEIETLEVVAQGQFKGFNIGFESQFRFDFNPQSESVDREYRLLVERVLTPENLALSGDDLLTTVTPVTAEPGSTDLAVQNFYSVANDGRAILARSGQQWGQILGQNWLVGLIVLLLIASLLIPDKKAITPKSDD